MFQVLQVLQKLQENKGMERGLRAIERAEQSNGVGEDAPETPEGANALELLHTATS